MNALIKIFSVLIVLVVLVVGWMFFGGGGQETRKSKRPEKKGYSSVQEAWDADDERLRGDIEEPEREEEEQTEETEENQKDSEEAGSGQETEQQTEEQEDTPENQQPKRQEFRKLNPEQKMQAEKLLEIVYMERKKARLPGFQYGRMVKYARQVIEQYPGTEEAAKAQRALAEIPERYRQRYRITDEELGPYK